MITIGKYKYLENILQLLTDLYLAAPRDRRQLYAHSIDDDDMYTSVRTYMSSCVIIVLFLLLLLMMMPC